MRKKRYEILLPLTHNDGRSVSPERFHQTQQELIERFGAVSAMPGTIRGTWVHEGKRYEDESMRLFVDVDDTEENRQFFAGLKVTFCQRFEQIETYIASYPVEIV